MGKVITVPLFNEYVSTQVKPYVDTKGSEIRVFQQGGTGSATICLYDSANNKISEADIDLPDEKQIVSAALDYANKKIIFTYKDQTFFSCDISALINDLDSKINTKLDKTGIEVSNPQETYEFTILANDDQLNPTNGVYLDVCYAESEKSITASVMQKSGESFIGNAIGVDSSAATMASYGDATHDAQIVLTTVKGEDGNDLVVTPDDAVLSKMGNTDCSIAVKSYVDAVKTEVDKCVKFAEPQTLTAEQQAQARKNINSEELFVINYGEASGSREAADALVQKISVAKNAGKLVVCYYNGFLYQLSDTSSGSYTFIRLFERGNNRIGNLYINSVHGVHMGSTGFSWSAYTSEKQIAYSADIKNPTITVKQGTTTKGSFTLNQDSSATITIDDSYTNIQDKPKINNVELSGNKTGADLGLEDADPEILRQGNVIDNAESFETDLPLSANQGRLLSERISNLQNIGRFLAVWDANQGKPTTEPDIEGTTYNYKVGDYYRIGVAGTKLPALNDTYTIGGTNYYEGPAVSNGDVLYITSINTTEQSSTWAIQAAGTGGTIQEVTVNGTSVVTEGIASIDLTGKQDIITDTSKLSSDLVDDADKTNKFVTATEKSTWNAKQNAITTSNKLSATLISNDSTHRFTTDTEKSTWNGKSTVSVSSSGTSLEEVKYIIINGIEKKIAGGAVDSVNGQTGAVVLNAATNLYIDETAQTKTTIKAYIDNIVGNVANELDTIMHGGN